MNKKIDESIVEEFSSFLNERKSGEKIDIYLNSPGGSVCASEAIYSMISLIENTTSVYAYGEICSTALELFFRLNCKRYLLPGCIGMYHRGYATIAIDETGSPTYKSDEAQLKFLKSYCNNSTEIAIKDFGFTPLETKKIRRGDDVWFMPKRMEEILEFTNKL